MTNAERERAIQALAYYGEKLGCKAEFDLAIKTLEAYDKILPLLNPEIDAELALEKIREVMYD